MNRAYTSRPRKENDSHAQVEDRKIYDHQECGICHHQISLPCWCFLNRQGELVVRPDFERKVLVRMRHVNPEQTRQRPGKNASISRSTDLHSRCSKSFLQLEKINLNLCLQGRETGRGAGRHSEAPVVPCIFFGASVTRKCPS